MRLWLVEWKMLRLVDGDVHMQRRRSLWRLRRVTRCAVQHGHHGCSRTFHISHLIGTTHRYHLLFSSVETNLSFHAAMLLYA